jgi:hypothetical protein
MQALYKHILTVIYGGRHHDHQESQGTEKLSKLSKVSQQSSRGLSPGHLALEFMPITRLFILESEVTSWAAPSISTLVTGSSHCLGYMEQPLRPV